MGHRPPRLFSSSGWLTRTSISFTHNHDPSSPHGPAIRFNLGLYIFIFLIFRCSTQSSLIIPSNFLHRQPIHFTLQQFSFQSRTSFTWKIILTFYLTKNMPLTRLLRSLISIAGFLLLLFVTISCLQG